MKILIVSDTHRHNANLIDVIEKSGKLDLIIHCGDAEGTEEEIRQKADCPLIVVKGNNDFFSNLEKEVVFNIEQYKVMVTHGHYYNVSVGVELLVEEALVKGVDIVMYGHTHRPHLEIRDDIVIINPGSISYPRQDGRKPSYIIMEIDRFGDAHYTLNYI